MVNLRKISLVLTVVLLLGILLSGSALADLSIDSNSLIFNVDYENLRDNDDSLEVSKQITITNNGANTEQLTFSLEGLAEDYDLTVTNSLELLSNGGSNTITISGEIPVNVDAGVRNIGTLKVSGASDGEHTYTLQTDVEPMLELKRVEVYVNGQKEKIVNSDGETVDDIKPGDEVELRIAVKNLFDEDYDDGDIDGTINIVLDDSNFGGDIDLEEDFDISAGDYFDTDAEEIVFTFTIPADAEEDEYKLEVSLESEDGNNAEHNLYWEIMLNVEREKNDVRVERAEVTPAELSCVRNAQLVVEVQNYGSEKQKHAALSVYNQELGLNENFEFELQKGSDKGNNYIKNIPLEFDADLEAGTYGLVVSVFYDYNVLDDKEVVDLTVEDCAVTNDDDQADVDEEEEEEVVDDSSEDDKDAVKSVEREPLTKEDYLIGLIAVAIMAVLFLIVLLTVALFRR